jgi:uncharacterized membrane protein YqjE
MVRLKRLLAVLAFVFAIITVVSLCHRKKEKSPAAVFGGTCVCLIIKLIAAINRLAESINSVSKSVYITAAEIIASALLHAGAKGKPMKKAG